jgi:hypothetical protein
LIDTKTCRSERCGDPTCPRMASRIQEGHRQRAPPDSTQKNTNRSKSAEAWRGFRIHPSADGFRCWDWVRR